MPELKAAGLARSRAGHDKGELYIIISVQGEYAYLSDGLRRPLNKQKRKNKKHLQIVCVQSRELASKLSEGLPVHDHEIASLIRAYKQEEGKENVESRRD